MGKDNLEVVYWDASAILSTLFKDAHSNEAQDLAHKEGIHLISTLAYAETCSVIARMQRERLLADILIKAALEILEEGPWRFINLLPDRKTIESLSSKWPLRGADLWHLSTAKTLQEKLPELSLLTFDARLQTAAHGEGLTNISE